MVGNLAVGAEKVFFYSYNYDQSLLDPSTTPLRTLTARALAVRAFADQLQTAVYHRALTNTLPFVEGHYFKNGDEIILVIWSNEPDQDIEAALSGAAGTVTLFDPLGNAHELRERSGKVRFRVHYEPQYIRGFTNIPSLSFGETTNDPPYITTQPVTTAKVGHNYFYNADAYDPDPTGERHAIVPAFFALEHGPAGMQLDPTSGVLTWFQCRRGNLVCGCVSKTPTVSRQRRGSQLRLQARAKMHHRRFSRA